ncbi:hypothetical protein U1Q18_036930 [Sarracenia purpurea var. burkii]
MIEEKESIVEEEDSILKVEGKTEQAKQVTEKMNQSTETKRKLRDVGTKRQRNHHQALLILRNDDDDDDDDERDRNPKATIASAAMALTSWLRHRRRRFLLLAFFSPLILPFLCATFPLVCAAEVCIRLCRLRRNRRQIIPKSTAPTDDHGGDGLRRCEEGGGDEVWLLQRYLEDQSVLVNGSVYDCGDGIEDGGSVEFFDARSP